MKDNEGYIKSEISRLESSISNIVKQNEQSQENLNSSITSLVNFKKDLKYEQDNVSTTVDRNISVNLEEMKKISINLEDIKSDINKLNMAKHTHSIEDFKNSPWSNLDGNVYEIKSYHGPIINFNYTSISKLFEERNIYLIMDKNKKVIPYYCQQIKFTSNGGATARLLSLLKTVF